MAGAYDPRHVLGVTTLDVVRAARFTASVAKTSDVRDRLKIHISHA